MSDQLHRVSDQAMNLPPMGEVVNHAVSHRINIHEFQALTYPVSTWTMENESIERECRLLSTEI
jgi:hypothetical protein